MTHDEMIEVIQAHKDGKVIQGIAKVLGEAGEWLDQHHEPAWDFAKNNYRAKPMPKEYWLVPYTDRLGFMVFDSPITPANRITFFGLGLDMCRDIHVVTVVKDA
jgi:hypothetical protein